jgi:hypothetical protein
MMQVKQTYTGGPVKYEELSKDLLLALHRSNHSIQLSLKLQGLIVQSNSPLEILKCLPEVGGSLQICNMERPFGLEDLL